MLELECAECGDDPFRGRSQLFAEWTEWQQLTPTPAFIGAFAEFERHRIKQRVAIGIRPAREEGTNREGLSVGQSSTARRRPRFGRRWRSAIRAY